MLKNSEMTANRFARWAVARRKFALIQKHLAAGRTVVISTALRGSKLSAKHAAMVKATRSGLYLQRGKNWDCIDYSAIRVYE